MSRFIEWLKSLSPHDWYFLCLGALVFAMIGALVLAWYAGGMPVIF